MRSLPVVSDFMDKSFSTVTPTTRIGAAIELMLKKGLTGILVVDEETRLVGILSEKDCLKILLQEGFHRMPDDRVSSYMHKSLKTIDSGRDIIQVAQIFLENTFRRLPVVDDGKLVGQITRRDIVRGMHNYFGKLKKQGK